MISDDFVMKISYYFLNGYEIKNFVSTLGAPLFVSGPSASEGAPIEKTALMQHSLVFVVI